jgi:hypothetical protein
MKKAAFPRVSLLPRAKDRINKLGNAANTKFQNFTGIANFFYGNSDNNFFKSYLSTYEIVKACIKCTAMEHIQQTKTLTEVKFEYTCSLISSLVINRNG